MPRWFQVRICPHIVYNPWNILEGGYIDLMADLLASCATEEQARACCDSQEMICLIHEMEELDGKMELDGEM